MPERRALIQCGDHWENQRRVLSLAGSLAKGGWEPLVMTYGRHEGTLFLRHGIDVAPLATRGGRSPRDEARRAAFALSGRSTYRGVDVDDVARIERARQPQLFETRTARVRWRLALARRVDALHAVLDEASPERVFIWNGLTGVVANGLRQLAARHDLSSSFLERGLLPESVFVDPEGTGGLSQLHRLTLEELPEHGVVALPTFSSVPTELRAEHGFGARRVVFVPLQVERDTNILFHSDGVRSMRELLVRVSAALHGSDAVIVARRHPEETDAIRLPERANLRHIDAGSVEAWCDAADLVVTVSSTVGLTALLRGKPVVALGRAIYTNKGLCREPRIDELGEVLRDPATYIPPERARVERFARALLGGFTVRGPTDGLPAPRPRGAPMNVHHVAPSEFAARWEEALAAARRRAVAGVQIRWQVRPKDRLRLTYRKQREPIDREGLQRGLTRMLDVENRGKECGPNVVIAPQARRPAIDRDTILVLDPHLEPHARWLLRR